jgi:subtilisin family serine protease
MGRSILPTRGLLASFALVACLAGSLLGATAATAESGGTTLLVVGYGAGVSPVIAAAFEHSHGLNQVSDVAGLHARVVSVASSNAAATIATLRNAPGVSYVQSDNVLTPEASSVAPNDPSFTGGMNGQEWGENVDQANLAWSDTTGSASVTIAVIDSGVDPTQPDLASVLVPGWNVLTNSSNTTDTYGHGTEVAGVAVAGTNNGQGVAAYCWSCRLMPVEVYNSGTGALASNVASGITWAVNHGANVINISLGGAESSVEDSAVAYALAHNVVVVAAAGNNGSSTPIYPAADPGVISVAASDQTDTLYSYSGYGSWVDLAAPGSQATTLPNGGYGSVGGTSVASPAVAGIAALMLSVNPTSTPSQIANALFTTTNPVNGANQVAHGRVNAYAAIQAIGGVSNPISVPTNTAPPAISGTAQVGQTLSASSGVWSNTPTSYGYQWLRCSLSSCASIAGATSSSYAPGSADVGSSVEVAVTATNSGGSSSATSAPTSSVTVIALSPPANISLPAVSGIAQQGQTLSATSGSWSGSPTSYTYQWQRCSSSGCATVAGATSSTYVLGSADVGSLLEVSVKASNSAGSSSAASSPTASVSTSVTSSGTGKGGGGHKK